MEKNKSNTIDNSNNIRTLNSLYNLLVDSLTEFLPIYVSLNNQTYSKNSLPSDVISAKIRLHEIETANLKAMDLRGGAALIIAALQADGVTEISNIEYVLRGYEYIDKKLRKLGAEIKIKEGE